MQNPVVEQMLSQIGQSMHKSPSAVGRWLNGTLLSVEEGKVRVEFVVRPEMTNPMNILHGGTSAMIMDETIGVAVHSLNNEHFFTSINLAVDFLAPAQEGERIIAVAEIIRLGKTVINAECRILSESGKIIAKGMSNLVRTRLEKKKSPAVQAQQKKAPKSKKEGRGGRKQKDNQKKSGRGKDKRKRHRRKNNS